MRLKAILIGLWIFAIAGSACAADFVTTASIDQASPAQLDYKHGRQLYADVTVQNVTSMPQNITVWGNPAESWMTDSNQIITNQDALGNMSSITALAPGQIYSTKILLMVPDNLDLVGPFTFRIGFVPNEELGLEDMNDPSIIWSNSVTFSPN